MDDVINVGGFWLPKHRPNGFLLDFDKFCHEFYPHLTESVAPIDEETYLTCDRADWFTPLWHEEWINESHRQKWLEICDLIAEQHRKKMANFRR